MHAGSLSGKMNRVAERHYNQRRNICGREQRSGMGAADAGDICDRCTGTEGTGEKTLRYQSIFEGSAAFCSLDREES